MTLTVRQAHKLVLFTLFITSIPACSVFSDEPRKPPLVELLTNQWFSRDSVEFTEIVLGHNKHVIECQVAFDTKGRLSMRRFVDPSQKNPRPPEDFIKDGTLIHHIGYFSFEPHNVLIDHIHTTNQAGTVRASPDQMTALLWLLMPGGRPPYSHVAHSRSIRMEEDSASKHPLVRVESEYKNARISIYLDPELQYAVRRVRTVDSSYLWEASEFKQIDGFWLPIRGKQQVSRVTSGAPVLVSSLEFTVTDIAVNKPLRYSSFSPPEPTDGAMVIDATKKTSRLKGTAETRERLQKKYSRTNLAPPTDLSYEPSVPSPTSPMGIAELLALLSLCVILRSLYLRRKTRQSRVTA